jgi:CheY-like chemotaxis protein
MQDITGKKLLIVEDELPLAKMLSEQFVAAGLRVTIAGDGEEGLKKALEWQPDLILLDIIMPRMDGMTMLHKLRSHPEGKATPVILLTNLSDTQNVYDAMANGVYDFLVKSNWEVDDLVKEVRTKLLNSAEVTR